MCWIRPDQPTGRQPVVALLHLQGLGLLGHDFHCSWKEVATAFVLARLPPLDDLPLLLVELARQLRRRYHRDDPPEWLHSHRHVHILLHLHAHKGARDRKISPDLVEVESDLVATGPVRDDDVSGKLLVGDGMSNRELASDLDLRGVHLVPFLPVRSVLRAIVHEAEEVEEDQERLSLVVHGKLSRLALVGEVRPGRLDTVESTALLELGFHLRRDLSADSSSGIREDVQ